MPVSVSVHSPVPVSVRAPLPLPHASTPVTLARAIMPALGWGPAAGVSVRAGAVDAAARWPAAPGVLGPVLSSGSMPGLIPGPGAVPGPAGGSGPPLSCIPVVPAAVGAGFWASAGLVPSAAVRPARVVGRPVRLASAARPPAVPVGGAGEGARGLGLGSWALPLRRGLFQAAEGWGAAGGLAGVGGSCCCLLHRGGQGQSCSAEAIWGGCLRRACEWCWRRLCRGSLRSCWAVAKAAGAGSTQHCDRGRGPSDAGGTINALAMRRHDQEGDIVLQTTL